MSEAPEQHETAPRAAAEHDRAARLDDAIGAYRQALARNPDDAEAHLNLGTALHERGDVEGAIAALRRAVAIRPFDARAHVNLGRALLLTGDFAAGWREYEWRLRDGSAGPAPLRAAKAAPWQGDDLAGRSLLLIAEPGLGETLLFARFAPLLSDRGARVVLAAPSELAGVLGSLRGVEVMSTATARAGEFDVQLPLPSVASVLAVTEATIPAEMPYLAADPERVARWRQALPEAEFTVGVAWQAGSQHLLDQRRSIPPHCLAPLAALPGVRLFSLQQNAAVGSTDDLKSFGPDFAMGPDAFADAAAAMTSLDLVIAADGPMADLAGALGRPVWVALTDVPDWRWLLAREDSPWYPTARLFRQRQAGDWDEVFERVAAELRRAAGGDRAPLTAPKREAPASRPTAAIAAGPRPRHSAAMRSPQTVLKQCRHGKMLYLANDLYVGRSLDLYGEYSELEAETFAQILRPGDTAVEVGANLGAHTVVLGNLVGNSGMVLAFEPQRIIFQILCANLALNNLFQVRAYHMAAGSQAGMLTVPTSDYAAEGNFGGLSLKADGAGEQVPVRTLDSMSLAALRLLKVDVEGMEVDVLLGARQTIGKHRPVLYVENDRKMHSRRLIALINELGYDMWWHLPRLYNPKNFAQNANNVFGGTISINLLCIPRETPMQIAGMRRVSGPEDWWQTPSS